MCAKTEETRQIGKDKFSFQHIIESIQQHSFICSLPSSLLATNGKRQRSEYEHQTPTENTMHTLNPWLLPGHPYIPPPPPPPPSFARTNHQTQEPKKYIINHHPINKWAIKDRETFVKTFPKSCLGEKPSFNRNTKCCHCWATRAYCFENCPQRESHCKWRKQVVDKFDHFFRKCTKNT